MISTCLRYACRKGGGSAPCGFKPYYINLNLHLRQRTEAEGEGKRRAEQERELERLRRILRENTGSQQEKDEVIAGKKN
jgi:hypothetical protein